MKNVITVNELIKELEEIQEKGMGEYCLFVPCECGYTGADIIEGYDIDTNEENKCIILHSNDM